MGKVNESLSQAIKEKVKNSEKNQNSGDWESKKLNAIDDLIKGENIPKLQRFDFRNEILEVIYDDSKNGKYKEDYENSKIDKCDELTKTAFGKKWAKIEKMNFDYDSSNLSSYVFAKSILRQYNFECITRSSSAYDVKMKMQSKDEEVWFAGDTMNSWAETLENFFEKYQLKYFDEDFPGKGNPLWKYLSEKKLKNQLPLYITDFLKTVYTMGNFIPVPEGFNEPRSHSTKDYWDLTLLLIYKWYHSSAKKDECDSKDCYLQRLVGKQENIDHCKRWLNLFKDWHDFVEQNYMQPFVKQFKNEKEGQYGEPLELWDGHFNGGILPCEEWQFEQFFVNARIRILRRGKLIANALVENAKNDTNNEEQK